MLESRQGIVVVWVAGYEDHHGLRVPALDRLQDRGSTDCREKDVEEDEVEVIPPHEPQGLPTIRGQDYLVALGLQGGLEGLPHRGLIVHGQDALARSPLQRLS